MPKQAQLTIHEIYHSIQGESSWAGWPCVFVRTTFCDLRCSYCDTTHAFYEGEKMSTEAILEKVASYHCRLVEVTGGEPLLQPQTPTLLHLLCEQGYTVLLETSGAHPIADIDPRVHRIMDLKTPSSAEMDRNLLANIDHLNERDEVKFVIGTAADYAWAKDMVHTHSLDTRTRNVLFSPIFGKIDSARLVDWILRDGLPVRFQLQMHKFIWRPTERGV